MVMMMGKKKATTTKNASVPEELCEDAYENPILR
jgi:hypothetical protein